MGGGRWRVGGRGDSGRGRSSWARERERGGGGGEGGWRETHGARLGDERLPRRVLPGAARCCQVLPLDDSIAPVSGVPHRIPC